MIEAGAVGVVHIVEHPEHVPPAPGVVAPLEHCPVRARDVIAAVARVGEVDLPDRQRMFANGKIERAQRRDADDRSLSRMRRQSNRPGRSPVDRNRVPVPGIEQQRCARRSHFDGCPTEQRAQFQRGDRLVSQRRLDRGPGGRLMQRRGVRGFDHGSPGDRLHVQQGHGRAADRPQHELQPDRQPDPLVDSAQPERLYPHALAFFRFFLGKAKTSSQAPDSAISTAPQVNTRKSRLLTFSRSA